MAKTLKEYLESPPPEQSLGVCTECGVNIPARHPDIDVTEVVYTKEPSAEQSLKKTSGC